ncbi:MAG: hypothetical protein ACE14S_04460, partial [Candidatus Bathyarchaeia archaeon]
VERLPCKQQAAGARPARGSILSSCVVGGFGFRDGLVLGFVSGIEVVVAGSLALLQRKNQAGC